VVEATWANLSWRPGSFAVTHDVYFGESFDAVNDGAAEAFRGNQAEPYFVVGFPGFPYPEGLVPGTTYYWRIDEVNDTDPNSPWKGKVWSFSIAPKTAYDPDPAEAAEQVDPGVTLRWTAGFGSKLHTVYFGDNFDDVSNATGGLPQGAATFDPGTLKLAQTYYWRVDEFDAIETHKGHVWSFTTQGAVGSPNPAKGAVDVKRTQIISWSPSVRSIKAPGTLVLRAMTPENSSWVSPTIGVLMRSIVPIRIVPGRASSGALLQPTSLSWMILSPITTLTQPIPRATGYLTRG